MIDYCALKGKRDLVTCLEVVEHFENPIEHMKNLASFCKDGGFVAIGTELIPTNSDFSRWWYIQDSTHVSLYSEDALIQCCNEANLEFVVKLTKRSFLFRKKTN